MCWQVGSNGGDSGSSGASSSSPLTGRQPRASLTPVLVQHRSKDAHGTAAQEKMPRFRARKRWEVATAQAEAVLAMCDGSSQSYAAAQAFSHSSVAIGTGSDELVSFAQRRAGVKAHAEAENPGVMRWPRPRPLKDDCSRQ